MFAIGAVNIGAGVDVGAVLTAALREREFSHKQAALMCGVNEVRFSRALKGEQPLDFWWLRHLLADFRLAQIFLGRLASALIQQFFTDLHVPYRMVRADVQKAETKEKVS